MKEAVSAIVSYVKDRQARTHTSTQRGKETRAENTTKKKKKRMKKWFYHRHTCSPKKRVIALSWSCSLFAKCCNVFGPSWKAAKPSSEVLGIRRLRS